MSANRPPQACQLGPLAAGALITVARCEHALSCACPPAGAALALLSGLTARAGRAPPLPVALPAETLGQALALARATRPMRWHRLGPALQRRSRRAGQPSEAGPLPAHPAPSASRRERLGPQPCGTALCAGTPWPGRCTCRSRCVSGPHWLAAGALPVGARLDPAELKVQPTDWASRAGPAFHLGGRIDRPGAGAAACSRRPRCAQAHLRPHASGLPRATRSRWWHRAAVSSSRTEGQALAPGIEGQAVRVRT